MTPNLWDEAKPVLREKFMAIQSHLKKQEKSQINNLPTLKTTRERRKKKTQSQQKERNHKDQSRNK